MAHNKKILGSVKLHIGDSWGKMKTFALGHFHGETQTLGGVFGELRRWFKFTLKPPNSIASEKLRLAIWDTSFWTFWVKFGHNGP